MQRKYKFKLVTFIMLLALVPSMNLGTIPQDFNSGRVTPTSLGKMLSPQEVGATTSNTHMSSMLKSVVPTSSVDFEGTTIPQPSRPALNMKLPTEATNGTSFGYQSSIAGLTGITAGQIEVIKNGVPVQNYTSVTDSNVQTALQYIYSNADSSSDFVLFIGGNVTLSSTTMSNTTTGGTFASLNGKVKSITIIANTTDSLVSSPNVAASGNYTITTPTNNYFGASTAFRNVNVAAVNDNFYAQGNPIAFMPGSNFTGTGISVYGGSDGTSSVMGDTNIYVGSTGTGTMSFYGGNSAGGNISGNTHVSIINASGLGTVTGGNASGGIISGDTNVSVTGFTGNIASMYGAGVGTSANPVTVNGNVYNNWNSTISGASYNGTYYGGAGYGTIKGTIYNTFKGLGSYNGEEMYNGGVQNGTVGVSGVTNSAIVNDYDTSKFTGGYANFAGIAGANNAGGSNSNSVTVYGNVINYTKTGYGTSGTSFMGGAAGAYGADYLYNTKMPASGTANDANPTAAAATAESSASEKLYGNAYTWLRSGLVGAGYDYNIVLGGGYGFIKGNTIMEVGDASTAPGGNTSGENGVTDGSRSSSTRTGIGGSGFVVIGDQGDGSLASTEAANGVNYNGNNTNIANSYYLNDIVGGGGNDAGNGSNYWQVGDSYLIQNNSAARWTYGAGWSGNQIGNSYNFNNGAVTDTLEGGMYGSGGTVYGNTSAQFNNGQTDWFLSGGAWNGRYISGNMTTIVNNGVIPANTGGNYALAGNNVTGGDSSVYIYGGDFSNAPRQDGPKTVCGGNFNSGNSVVYGNSSLTLDLTGPNGNTFQFPSQNTYLSAGPGYNKTGVQSGTDAKNTINLTIKANASTATKLSSATIYGDGSNSTNIKAGTINMLIDADGATVGNVYASNRSIISSSGLARNVTTKIGEGTTIAGSIYNSASSDNLTSVYANSGSNVSMIQFGDRSGGACNPIMITGKVVNFTSAKVISGVNTTVSGGLLNGTNATATNHAATYSKHGTIEMDEDSILAVSSSTSVISGSKLIAYPNATLSTPYVQTSGLINLSDLDLSTNKGNLFWKPIGNPPASISNTYNGAYWGTQSAFPILTFNGGDTSTKSGAANITPNNFSGVDSAKNYAFLGDYTMSSLATPSNPTWIGYVVPGQVRVYNTTGDADSGNWQHHLKSNITTGNPVAGQTMQAWASVASDTDASSIKVMYVMGYSDSTTAPFSFTAKAPYYIKSRTATAFDGKVLNDYPSTNPNFDVNAGTTGATRNFGTRDYFVGNQQDGTNDQAIYGSYIVQNVATDNTTSLSAGNYILPNKGSAINASSLTQAQLQKIVGLKGVGVMTDITTSGDPLSSINNAGNTIQDPTTSDTNVKDKSYAEIPVSWTLGKSSTNSNIVVVPQAAVISSDSQTALNVYDASMTSDDAHNLKDQKDLDGNWTYALAFKADGTIEEPVISSPSDLVTTLQTIQANNPIIDGDGNIRPVTYTYNGLSKDITLNLTFGAISLSTPNSYDFGTLDVSPKPLISWATSPASDVVVTDTRTGSALKPWYVSVAQTQDLKGLTNDNNLASYLFFKDSTESKVITSDALQIYANTSPTTGTFKLNQNWNSTSDEGIQLNIPVDHQEKGTYEGQLTWSLNNVPSN
ncbi:beta strand repeat-containing protein [Lactococcus cremoris]